MNVKRILNNFFVLFLFTWFTIMQAPSICAQQHDRLEYEVSVKITSVPFTAIDSRGQPVYDLKQEELELYVNGKLTPIYSLSGTVFNDMAVSEEKPVPAQAETPVKKKTLQEPPKRLIIIVVDALFNSNQGLTYSKQIARKLIESGSHKDTFVLVQIELGGLKYIAGPAPGGQRLLKSLKKIKKNPQTVRMFTPFTSDRAIAAAMGGDTSYIFMSGYGNRRSMRISVEMYKDVFKQLKNALRTYDGLKLTYLLSESFAGHLDEIGIVRKKAYDMVMEEIKNNIYDGGSVLQYVPLQGMRPHMIQGVTRWLTRSTSAFYELYFNPGPETGKNLNIDIRSKRTGVRINAASHKEREKSYKEMNRVQKKTFVISVATGLNWRRLPGSISRIAFIEKDDHPDELESRTIMIELPGHLMGRRLDIYTLRFDDRYQNVDIAEKSQDASDTLVLNLRPSEEKRGLYFVLVEPESGQCFFNEVK